jgi:hypothetical protein
MLFIGYTGAFLGLGDCGTIPKSQKPGYPLLSLVPVEIAEQSLGFLHFAQ